MRWLLLAIVAGCGLSAHAKGLIVPTEKSYRPDQGVVVLYVNWGRTWSCGNFENAQLQAVAFRKIPLGDPDSPRLVLKTLSRLLAKMMFERYAYVIAPGEYALMGFDVKVARSVSDVGHMIGDASNLIVDGKPIGGTFTVGAGKAVYVGSFGLECAIEPLIWRFSVAGRSDFEDVVGASRKSWPVLQDVPFTFRHFSTEVFDTRFALEDPVVK